MIKIYDYDGREHHLAVNAIARVSEPAASAAIFGIKAQVHLFDGKLIEAQDSLDSIIQRINEANAGQCAP